MQWLTNFWYQNNNPLRYLFYPLHLLLALLLKGRGYCYQLGILTSTRIKVPVIIVGNITVGGTGKSPLVIHLAKELSAAGMKVGILSRGYGGNSKHYPMTVEKTSSVNEVGDEPLMIKQRLDLPLVVDPKRVRGAQYLQDEYACDLIICDDGLQHYALYRDIELLVVDGQRNFGNGLLMPFGPLRETVSRTKEIDGVIVNNGGSTNTIMTDNLFHMKFKTVHFINLKDNQKNLEIADLLNQAQQQDSLIQAVAAIGNPQRFFLHLQQLGFKISEHEFIDHHRFTAADFNAIRGTIIMTEKDAVKCASFATENMWYLKVDAEISPSISQYCLQLLASRTPNKMRKN